MQWHSLSLLQKSPEALAKFIIEQDIAHYKKGLAQISFHLNPTHFSS